MSRRDTIIVAVLLNTGLLAVLFMMAINTDDDRLSPPSEVQQMAAANPEPIKVPIETDTHVIAMATPATTQGTSGDELDNVLKDYAANMPPQTIVLDDDNADSIEKEPVPVEPKEEIKPEKATAEKPTATASSGKTVDVAVKKGDSLDKIARSNGTTVEAIKKASNLKNDKLKVGQVLKVPVGSKKAETKPVAAKKEEPKVVASNEIEYYTIQKGDNPWKIAKQYKVKFDDLLKLNNLDEEKARNLKVGDKVRVK